MAKKKINKAANAATRILASHLRVEGGKVHGSFNSKNVYKAWCDRFGGNRYLTGKAMYSYLVYLAHQLAKTSPPPKVVKAASLPKPKVQQAKNVDPRSKEFLLTREWREVRYRILKRYGGACQCCGRRRVVLHVDHIKPRHTHPHLALMESNLQVLCEDCNIGKGAWDSTDWR